MAFDQKRLDQAVAQIGKTGLDALLVAPSEDLAFVLGHSPYLCERFQGLFILPDGDYFYICNLLTADEMKAVLPNGQVYAWFDGDGFTGVVAEVLAKKGLVGKTIGVSLGVRAFNILEIADVVDVTWVSARGLLNDARIIKSERELEALRRVSAVTDEAFLETLPQMRAGMTEQEVKKILIANMQKRGGNRCGASVASGPNGSYPHYNEDGRALQQGDAVVIDFGCQIDLLYSDCTRTVFVGEPGERQRRVYDAVLRANLAGEQAARDGAYIPDVDKAARGVIEAAGYGPHFTTRLGHGIGYQGHEAPDIKQSNHAHLGPGMAFSIEPGVYLAGDFGVRIEDIVIINLQGETEVLNKTSKELTVLG